MSHNHPIPIDVENLTDEQRKSFVSYFHKAFKSIKKDRFSFGKMFSPFSLYSSNKPIKMNDSMDLKDYVGRHVEIVFNEQKATNSGSGFLANGFGAFHICYFIVYDNPIDPYYVYGPFWKEDIDSITVSSKLFKHSYFPQESLNSMATLSLSFYPIDYLR